MTTFAGQQFQGAPQFGQQFPQQGQIATNISVRQVPASQGQRQPTIQSINTHRDAAGRKGPNDYWQATNPPRPLKLTHAVRHVEQRHPNTQGINRFVYWPDYRVAGTISDILQVFQQAGYNTVQVGELNRMTGGLAGQPQQQVQLSANVIANNAFDPLNPQHQQILEQFRSQAQPAARAAPKRSLEEFIMISKSIKAHTAGSTAIGEQQTRTVRAGTGARAPDAKQSELVNRFNQLMQMAAQSGQNPGKVLNVTDFDVDKFTKARQVNPPGRLSKAIQPYVNVNGNQIPVPVIAQPQGVNNFMNFVRSIVANSAYSQYANEILNSFQNQLQQPQQQQQQQFAGFGQAPTGFGQAPTGFGQAPTGFGQAPTGFGQMQLGASSPAGTMIGGQQPFALPQVQQQQPFMMTQAQQPPSPTHGGMNLPQVGRGVGLPQVGLGGQTPGLAGSPGGSPAGSPAGSPRGSPRTAPPSLPTVAGGINLPGMRSQFPSIALPSGQQ